MLAVGGLEKAQDWLNRTRARQDALPSSRSSRVDEYVGIVFQKKIIYYTSRKQGNDALAKINAGCLTISRAERDDQRGESFPNREHRSSRWVRSLFLRSEDLVRTIIPSRSNPREGEGG